MDEHAAAHPHGLRFLVPVAVGLCVPGLVQAAGRWEAWLAGPFAERWPAALTASAFLAFLAWAVGGVDLSGAAAGFLLASALWLGLGPAGFLLLAAFFVLGTASTRVGYEHKSRAGHAQRHGGRRSARHAVANAGVAAAAALFASVTPHAAAYRLAAAAALAAALADTLGSELGMLWGRRAYLVTTGRRVPPGTDGAVSLPGTAAGLAGALIIAVLALPLGLYDGVGTAAGAAIVTAGALVGCFVDSLLGATCEPRGWLDNQGVNFLGTLAGGAAAGLAAALL